MLSGVLGVKESISDDIMSVQFHLGRYSEQEAQLDPYCSLKNRNFHKNKMTLECNRYIRNISSSSNIVYHCDSFCSHLV